LVKKFLEIIVSKKGSGYVYGGQNDDLLTIDKLEKLVSIFGKKHYYFDNYSAEKWIGKEYYDCSGLIVYTLRQLELIPINKDYTASDIYKELCIPINKEELKEGNLVFSGTNGITHVGIYIGNNKIIHSRGTFYGVVETSLFNSFNKFGRLKFFEQINCIEKYEQRRITADKLNVRNLPSTNGDILGQLNKNDLIYINGICDNWLRIIFNNKLSFIHGSYTQYEKSGNENNCDELLEKYNDLFEMFDVVKTANSKVIAENKKYEKLLDNPIMVVAKMIVNLVVNKNKKMEE